MLGTKALRDIAPLLLLSCAALCSAQDYPVKPVRIVIGFPPGGPNELTARPVAQKLQELLGQPFILDHRPGKLNFASSGTGGSLHLSGELFMQVTGVEMVHVPYKGAAPALTEVIGGHVDSMFIAAPPAIPHIRSGKVRALGVASPQRAPALPDVPTMAEGGLRGFEIASDYGIVARTAIGCATSNAQGAPDEQQPLQ